MTLSEPCSTSQLLQAIPTLPHDETGPVFDEPWQADVFAMTLLLHQRGLITWTEWATALSTAINQAREAGDPDLGDTYYSHWLNALESILISKEICDRDQLEDWYSRWDQAARNTLHGDPISLD